MSKLTLAEVEGMLVTKKALAGAIKFSNTLLTDPHIQHFIKLLVADRVAQLHAEGQNVTVAEVEQSLHDHIDAEVAKFNDIAKISPLLYNTIELNIIEDVVFKLVEKMKTPVEGAPVFSTKIFNELLSKTKIEYKRFFPLRNFIDHKTIHHPRIIFTPGLDKKYASVKTAAATETGDFIFNIPFMQSLLNFAHVKGLKPKSKKYVVNGGKIPNEYAYIEFLIMHEFMHYTQADFHYQRMYKEDNKVINWVGDFRSNYLLVKSGHEQLPMGLFNDLINLDRQKSYREMVEVVKAEFNKLPKQDQDRVSDHLGDMSDDHDQSEPDPNAPESPEPSDEAQDAAAGAAEEAMGDEAKGDPNDEKAVQDEKDSKKSGAGKGEKPGSGRGAGHKFDYDNVQPTISWKAILSKLIAAPIENSEETYQKPSRRTITSMNQIRQVGAGAVKAGEKITELLKPKLVIVIDASGSMMDALRLVLANITNLFKKNPALSEEIFFLVKFSGGYETYACSVKAGSAVKVDLIAKAPINAQQKAALKNNKDLQKVFTEAESGGTVFSTELANKLGAMAGADYNVLIFSDSDLLWDSNWDNFLKIYTEHKGKIWAIFDDKSTFQNAARKLKSIPRTMSHM